MPYPASDACGWWLAWGIQQWGLATINASEVVFPISFSDIRYSFVYSLNYGSGTVLWDEVLSAPQVDMTSSTYRTKNKQKVGSRVGNWFAIGKQQWGTTQNTVIFPLKFTQFTRVFCTNNCSGNNYSTYAMNAADLTLTGFQRLTASNPGNTEVCAWLAVGI